MCWCSHEAYNWSQHNDLTCIYSTLRFISYQSATVGIPTPCITFYHPLWLKAVDIIQSEKLNIVCRLGPFHTMMSFLASIGSVMAGSGLTEVLECCYGSNTVTHMISGEAVKRAVRGHFFVETALRILMLRHVLNHSSHHTEDIAVSAGPVVSVDEYSRLNQLYDDTLQHRCDVSNLECSSCLQSMQQLTCELEAV